MNTFIKRTGLVLLKSLLLLSPAQAATELTIGDAAPDFSLKDQNYKIHTLGDYKDQWLVLYFYPKDDTPGCTREACNFRDDIIHIKALKASVMGVSLDDSKSHEEFAKKFNLPFPLLADTEGTTAEIYGALFKLGPMKFAKRHSFIIGPDGLIKKIYRDVDPKEHSQQIIADLKALIEQN